MGTVANMYLSAFGRAFAASSYGLSTTLYQAEFLGLPPAAAEQLSKAASDLVDRNIAPGGGRKPPGVHTRLLYGNPREGGFGLLPLSQHIQARHAAWGLRLLHYLLQPAAQHVGHPDWVRVAASILRYCCPGLHPASALLACAAQLRAEPQPAQPPSPSTPSLSPCSSWRGVWLRSVLLYACPQPATLPQARGALHLGWTSSPSSGGCSTPLGLSCMPLISIS